MRGRLSILFLSFLLAISATSQQLSFQSFEEEFPNRPIHDLELDSEGFLWIVTYGAGVYRFDGVAYESFLFDYEDPFTIPSNFVQSALEDRNGRLWVGTDRGLCWFDERWEVFRRVVFQDHDILPDEPISVHDMIEDAQGNLLIGTNKHGLIILNSDFKDDPVPEKFDFHITDTSLVYVGLATTAEGITYAATRSGLFRYDESALALESISSETGKEWLSHPYVSLTTYGEEVWLGTSNHGVIQGIPEGIGMRMVQHDISQNQIMDLIINEHTLVCAAENDGLISWNLENDVITKITHDSSNNNDLESNSIWSFEVDPYGRLWLGYYNQGIGLYDARYSKFEVAQHHSGNPNSLHFNTVNSVVEAGEDHLWIGMDGGGIDRLDLNTGKFLHLDEDSGYQGLDNEFVQTLFVDRDETLWVGSWEGGLYRLTKGSSQFRNYNMTNTNGGLKSNRISSIDQDVNGRIWIATFGGWVHYFDPETNSIIPFETKRFEEEGIQNEDVRDILASRDGSLWIGSPLGLFRIQMEEQDTTMFAFRNEYYQKEYNPDFNYVLSLYEDKQGIIWIGTDGAGLYQYDPRRKSLTDFRDVIGLELQAICGITEDVEGNFWFTGKSGIAKYIPGYSPEIIHYTKKDGLSSNDFNYNAIYSRHDGKLFFGSQEGLNMFSSKDFQLNGQPVKTYLKRMKLFNKDVIPGDEGSPLTNSLRLTDEITLNHEQSVFTLEYTGVNFTRSDKIEFAYYLEGLEDDWNYVGDQRSATYTSLQAGNYVFKLKAANNDGLWSDEVTSLNITILPAWYKSNLALTIYIILFFSGIILLNALIRKRIQERQEVLNERERREQGEQLARRKLQFFTNISHEFRTPLTLILNPLNQLVDHSGFTSKVSKNLLLIQRNARRLERLIDELMDFRKVNSGKLKIHVHQVDLGPFIREIVNYFEIEAEAKSIQLEVVGENSPYMVWVDSGLVEKMLFNLLSNAFKVTPEGGCIQVSLEEVKISLPLIEAGKVDAMCLSVADTGPGLKKAHIDKIFERFYQVEEMNQSYFGGTGIGLEVVKSFIELHKGHVDVASEPGEGTTFKLYFPLGKAHYAPEDIVAGEYPGKKEFLSRELATEVSETEDLRSMGKSSETLLIIDDNPELRNYLKAELQQEYVIEIAKNGKEGLEKAEKHTPDLIITDVMMPEMDGFEFCERIKQNLKTSHVPLVMLSAKGSTEDQITGMDKGADAYITKPFEINLLRSQLRTLLKSRQMVFDKYLGEISALEANASTTTADRDFMQEMLAFIYEHLADPQLSVEQMAEELSLSRSQLYRKIKALTGLKTNEFIRNIRLEKAKELLAQPNTNVNAVSHKVGFSSASYFTKCYKDHFGILPTQEMDGLKAK
ncbi:MAG: two-component regulator propeller domain-containing protein [Cytophagales bacterium]|nr:two-component regulator propeller domain-containing protein [Cytophagales bacterium]